MASQNGLDKTHVVLIDRTDGSAWTTGSGGHLLSPEHFRVSVLSGYPGKESLAAAPVPLLRRLDLQDHDTLSRTIEALHAIYPVHRIACTSERQLELAAELRGRFGIPGDDLKFTLAFRDKAEMKRIARAAGIPHADGLVLHNRTDALGLLDRHGAIVIKPRDLSGSQGVIVCRERSTLTAWLHTHFVPDYYLAEEYLTGQLYYIDAVVHRGIVAWNVSVYLRDTFAYARGLPLSAQTCDSPRLITAADDLLAHVVDAWGISAAVLHVEAFDDGCQLVLCEVAGRPGGAGVPQAFAATRGINLHHAKVLIDVGEDPRRIMTEPTAAHAGWTVHYSPGGWLVEYDDSAVASQAVYRAVTARVGDHTEPSHFSGTGISTYVFAADTAAAVNRLLAKAELEVHIGVTPFPHATWRRKDDR